MLELLRGYIGRYLVDEAPDGSEQGLVYSAAVGADRELAGGKVARGVGTLYVNFVQIFRGLGMEEMAGALIASLREAGESLHSEFVRVRAGGVSLDGETVLLPSGPEPHLASLTAMLARNGGAAFGDEMVKIDPVERRLYPLDLPALVDTSDVAKLPGVRRDVARRGRRARYIDAMTPRAPITWEEIGARIAPPARPTWVVFPVFAPGEETVMRPMGGAEALFRFTQSALNMNVWGDRTLLLMRELIETSAVSELIVGDLGEAAGLLRDAVTAG
jgi:hypothetical protein